LGIYAGADCNYLWILVLSQMIAQSLKIARPECDLLIGIASATNQICEQIDDPYKFLHPNEILYYQSLISVKARSDYFSGRYAAKQAIAAYTGYTNYKQVFIYPGVFGQPVVNLKSHLNLQVSISHTDALALALVFPESHPMGVDVEMIIKDVNFLSEDIATSIERRSVHVLNRDLLKGSTLLWTIKEALSKVLRTGLMTPFLLYEMCNVKRFGDIVTTDFTHFSQYRSLSWIAGNHACSIVLPKNSSVEMDTIIDIQLRLDKQLNFQEGHVTVPIAALCC